MNPRAFTAMSLLALLLMPLAGGLAQPQPSNPQAAGPAQGQAQGQDPNLISPSPDTIRTGTYQPLSRPVFIYVSKKASERPEVQKFVEFYVKNAEKLVREVNYVGLGDAAYQMVQDRFAKRTLGSVFLGANTVGVTIDQLLAKESGK